MLVNNGGNEIIIDTASIPDVDVISFGSYKMDAASNIGGIPRGRISQLIGDSGTGKSTKAVLLMIEAQKAYPEELVAFIDVEQAFDKEYAEKLGLDTAKDRLILIQPDSANQALDLLLRFVSSKLFSLVVLDSIPALVPDQNLNADVGDVQVASAARLLSNELRRVMINTKKSNTATLLINQWRANIGFTGGDKAMPGGAALKYYPSMTIDLKRKELVKKGEDFIGMDVQANFIKHRFGSPYTKTVYRLYYGEGIRKADEATEVALDLGIITRGGAWYTFPLANGSTERIQGMANVIEYYKDNYLDFINLEQLVINSFKKQVQEIVEEEELEEE